MSGPDGRGPVEQDSPAEPPVRGDARAGDALALVESPSQLLNVLELAHCEPSLAGIRIGVLAPVQGVTRTQLRAMVRLARGVGHDVTWHEPRLGGASVARSVRALAGELVGVRRLVVGDPCSGVIQVILAITHPAEVTLVDDRSELLGTAGRLLGVGARRRPSLQLGCAVRLFTANPIELPGVEVIANDFGWLRAAYGRPEIIPGADLVGSSLVENGHLCLDQYLTSVRTLAERHGIDRYLAHRKESDEKLAAIEGFGLPVVPSQLPLEILARRGPVRQRLFCFPSTVAHTLPLVLGDTAVEIVEVRGADLAPWTFGECAISTRF